MLIGFILRE
jgi:anti-anti-sigma regulatory factor